MVKGVGLRLLSRRGSCVQIPPSAPIVFLILDEGSSALAHLLLAGLAGG
jgi:hypothetical protein